MAEAQEVVVLSTQDFKQQKISESLQEAASRSFAGIPGGRYLVGGVLVDANGTPVSDETDDNDMPVKASQEDLDAAQAEIEELRRQLEDARAQQAAIVTGRGPDAIPTGADSEPFLSQMQGGEPFNVLRGEVEQAAEEQGESFDELMGHSMRSLSDMAQERGVDMTGVRTKSELAERIMVKAAEEQTSGGSEDAD